MPPKSIQSAPPVTVQPTFSPTDTSTSKESPFAANACSPSETSDVAAGWRTVCAFTESPDFASGVTVIVPVRSAIVGFGEAV